MADRSWLDPATDEELEELLDDGRWAEPDADATDEEWASLVRRMLVVEGG